MSLILNTGFTIGPGTVLKAEYVAPPTIVETGLVLHLDAGNPSSYPGSGSTWTDLVGSKAFTLYGNPTYSSNNGGYLAFNPFDFQYAEATSLDTILYEWTVETWFYYNGNYSGGSPCIITEMYAGNPINFTLGNTEDMFPILQAGFWDGGQWHTTGNYSLPGSGWYHIVGTWNGTNMRLYVNNSQVTATTPGGTANRGGVGMRLMRRWDAHQYMGGNLAVVRIYNADIGSTGVTTNFQAGQARFGY